MGPSPSGRRPVQGDDPLARVARSPASRSCEPVRRPGPRRPACGCVPAPGRAQALGHGPCRPTHRAGPLVLGAAPHARMVSAAAGPGQPPARPRWGSAIAQADRGASLGLGGRRGSARRAGSDGSSRSTGRRPGRPRQRSGSAVAEGGHRPAAERPRRRCAYPKFVTACGASVSWPASRSTGSSTAIQAPSEGVCAGPPAEAPSAQAVVRPSEVDDRREMTANAEASTRRSAAVWPAAGQLAIDEHHIYDF
jgi:hypothetical protein